MDDQPVPSTQPLGRFLEYDPAPDTHTLKFAQDNIF